MSDRLQEMMHQLAGEDTGLSAPPRIEAAVLAEFDRVQRRRRFASWSVNIGAIAAAIVIAIAISWRSKPIEQAAVQPVEPELPYIAIPYVAPLAPYERTQVVRMALPVAALVSAGFPMRAVDPGGHVEAEVILGQDGRAHAFRLISESGY